MDPNKQDSSEQPLAPRLDIQQDATPAPVELPAHLAAPVVVVGDHRSDLPGAFAVTGSRGPRFSSLAVIAAVCAVIIIALGTGTAYYVLHVGKTGPSAVTTSRKTDQYATPATGTPADAVPVQPGTILIPYQVFDYRILGTVTAQASEVNGRSVVDDTDKDTGAKYVFSLYKSDKTITDCSADPNYTAVTKVPIEGNSFNLCKQKNVYASSFTYNSEWYVAAIVSDDPAKPVPADKAAKIMASIQIIDSPKATTPSNVSPQIAVENAATEYMFQRYGSLELGTNASPLDGYSFKLSTISGNNARATITHPDGHTTTIFLHNTNGTWQVIWDGRSLASKDIGSKYELPNDWISTTY